MKPLWLVTDGASRGNPGEAGIAYMILDEAGNVLGQHAECIGRATNNEAEYRALILGLRAAGRLGTGHLTWISDSEVTVFQMQGKYRVSKKHLRLLHAEAMKATEDFAHVFMEHHRREDPRIVAVDALVNRALDECM